jgi:hypothetical protein
MGWFGSDKRLHAGWNVPVKTAWIIFIRFSKNIGKNGQN